MSIMYILQNVIYIAPMYVLYQGCNVLIYHKTNIQFRNMSINVFGVKCDSYRSYLCTIPRYQISNI